DARPCAGVETLAVGVPASAPTGAGLATASPLERPAGATGATGLGPAVTPPGLVPARRMLARTLEDPAGLTGPLCSRLAPVSPTPPGWIPRALITQYGSPPSSRIIKSRWPEGPTVTSKLRTANWPAADEMS